MIKIDSHIDFFESTVAQIQSDQYEASKRGVLLMWTIYNRPPDCPSEEFVVRKFEVGGGGEPVAAGDAFGGDGPLRLFREIFIRAGLHCMPREDADAPHVVETWT